MDFFKNDKVGIGHFLTWRDYEVVHVSTHGARSCDSQGQNCGTILYAGAFVSDESYTAPPGVSLARTIWGGSGQQSTSGYVHVLDVDFFTVNYPQGLGKTLLFLSACETQHPASAASASDVTNALLALGPGSGPFTPPLDAVLYAWTEAVRASFARVAATEFYTLLLASGITDAAARDTLQARGLHRYADTSVASGFVSLSRLARPNHSLRIREIVTVHSPFGVPLSDSLQDGESLTPMVIGAVDDGAPDSLVVPITLEGVQPDQPAQFTFRFELDGAPVDTPMRLADQLALGTMTRRGPFKYAGAVRVSADRDLVTSQTYDLEAIVDLPEGGTSRYEAKELTLGCAVPELGDMQATVSGGFARSIPRGGRGGRSQMVPAPIGARWSLTVQNRFESDFALNLLFDDEPQTGSVVTINDASLQEFAVGGAVGYGTPQRASFQLGTVTIRFEEVTQSAACGTLSAELVAFGRDDVQTPTSVSARFWTEIRRN